MRNIKKILKATNNNLKSICQFWPDFTELCTTSVQMYSKNYNQKYLIIFTPTPFSFLNIHGQIFETIRNKIHGFPNLRQAL